MIRKLMLFTLVAGLIVFVACKKENSKGTTNLKVHLTDSPFNASEVNVDIREVKVKVQEDTWIDLNTHVGIYNLLNFQNGIDTVLAQGVIPTGRLQEVRFVLGSNNSITIDNINYPMTVPSGSESGLKLKIDKDLNTSIDSVIVDFDAALSIFQTGTNEYKLKPVLKIKD